MKKIYLIFFLFVSLLVHAGIVTKDEAMQKGAQFMTSKIGIQKVLTPTTGITHRVAGSQKEPFYVFNIDGGGFVIVSGDDRTEEILGYSANGTFDVNNIPDNMRGLLQEYAEGIQYLDDHNIQVDKTSNRSVRRAVMTSIAPIMSQKWNQGTPYNNLCPEYDGKHAVTGCVATAMAQIMGHHRWPAYTTNPIPAYTTSTNKTKVAGVAANTPIRWNQIKDKYGWCYEDGDWQQYLYTNDQAAAIAELMLYCGTSVEMDYDVSGSGAYSGYVIEALVNNFDYEEETCRWLDRVDYSYSEWQDIIYKELQDNRPVLYSGQSAGGGHAFVVDGYDSEDYFHINWGWGGNSDGYFRLCILNPDEQGIGGSTSSDGYGTSQGCGIGIKPNDGVVGPASQVLSVSSMRFGQKMFNRKNATLNFTVTNLYSYLWNSLYETHSFEVGVRILDSNGHVVEELSAMNNKPEQSLDDMEYNKTYRYTYGSLQFGQNYANGNYSMIFVSRLKGTSTWYPCKNADRNIINFTIEDNQLTITNKTYIPNLTMTSYEVEGQKETNQELTIRVTAKNEGDDFRGDIYAYINLTTDNNVWDYDKAIAAGFIELANGESQTFEFKFTPEKSGLNTITILTGNQQLGDPIKIQIGAVDGPRLEQTDFECSPKLHYNDDGNYVYGNYLYTYTTIKNTGDADFTGTIYAAQLVYYSGQWMYSDEPESMEVTIPAGESYTVYKYIDRYRGVSQYMVMINYQMADDNEVKELYTSPAFEFRDVPCALKMSGASVANSNDEAQVINGNTFDFSATITNTGTEDYNGKLLVRRWEYLPSTKKWNSTNEYINYAVTAGQSEQFAYSFDNPGKEAGAQYELYIYYVYDEENFYLTYSNTYYFVDQNSSANVVFNRYDSSPDSQYDSDKEMYYFLGRNVDFTAYLSNIGGQSFNGKVRINKRYYFSDAEGYLTVREENDMSIASGEMGTVSFTINKGDKTYQGNEPDVFWFTVEIKGDDDTDYKQIYRFDYFELRPTAIINAKRVVAANSNGSTINGNTLDLSITLQNDGDADLSSGMLECNFYAINTSTNDSKYIETKNIENIALTIGESGTYNVAFNNPNVEGYDAYCVVFYFYNADVEYWERLGQTRYYYFSATGIDTLRNDTTGKKANVYDIGGRKVGSTDQMQLLRPGMYIVNGKKVVRK